MSLSTEVLLGILTLVGIINTISRWSAVREVVSKNQAANIRDLKIKIDEAHEYAHRTRQIVNDWGFRFVLKEDFDSNDYVLKKDFHEELNRIYNRIETKQSKP